MKNLFRQIVPRPASSAPIALLTDFGTADPYVGTMKGVIASVHVGAKVIDICHATGPQNVQEASYLLWSCYRFFPHETVFLVVVDPGVGTSRAIVLLRMASRWFLAPDNGVLDLILGDEVVESATRIRLTESPYILSGISNTFHGRDVFAPVGAYLLRGVSPMELGERIDAPKPQSSFVTGKQAGFASVLHIDHFGNIITNIRPTEDDRPTDLSVRGKTVRQWIRNYQEGPENKICMIMGSSGLVELVRKNGSAAAHLKLAPGARLGVHWS